ncbi:hypothetical protein RYX36_035938 [Vicia faba]
MCCCFVDMAASKVPRKLTTQQIGNTFVEQYYKILCTEPDQLHHFYYHSSFITRPQEDGTMKTITTTAEIRRNIKSLNYTSLGVEILSVDSQPAYSNGVMVVVTGFFTGADVVSRKFAQSFFLAPKEKGFYVSNDVFRYVDDDSVDFEFLPIQAELVPTEAELVPTEAELEFASMEAEPESGNLVNNIRSNLRKFLSFF